MKRREIFCYLKTKRPQVVFLQETFSLEAVETIWSHEWGGKVYYSHGISNARGVAVLIHKNAQGDVQTEGFWRDKEGRFLAVETKIQGKKILLINIYAPNEDRPEFFLKMFDFLDKDNLDFDDMIVGRDFNTPLDLQLDHRSSSVRDFHKQRRQILVEGLNQNELVDIWHEMHPDCFQFSFRRMEPEVTMSRLDYFFITPSLVGNVSSADIIPRYMTDHSMLELILDLEESPRGPGHWKLNSLHLKDKEFVDKINLVIEEQLGQQNNANLQPDIQYERT